MTRTALLVVLTIFATLAAISDVRQRRIPNTLVAAATLAGLTLQGLTSGAAGIGTGLAALATGTALLLPPFASGGVGAGDVKFLGTIGAFLSPHLIFVVFVVGAILGGLLAAVQLASQGRLRPAARWLVARVLWLAVAPSPAALVDDSPGDPERGLPYALPFAIAAVVVAWSFAGGGAA